MEIEKIKLVRKYAPLGLSEAKAALEQCGGNALEVIRLHITEERFKQLTNSARSRVVLAKFNGTPTEIGKEEAEVLLYLMDGKSIGLGGRS